ncbi:unnamed protein product [Calypogeia fissa]
MAAMIDLTETSSDEEDVPTRKVTGPPPPTFARGNGVLKRGTNGGVPAILGLAANPLVSGSLAAGIIGADRNGGHAGSEKRLLPQQNGNPTAVWKGVSMGKSHAAPMEEVSTSGGFSGWGDPLPPEAPFRSTPDDSNAGQNGTVSGTPPIPASNTVRGSENVVKPEPSSVGDLERRERKSPVQPGQASLASPPVPSSAAAPEDGVCRQFWRAGDYDANNPGVRSVQGAMDHVRVHPKFLHSNATSHKWALGAVAELLDNAVDEVQNGATFVNVDKIVNPRDGAPALLVQDDGGGMAPDTMRACMSLGYSRKNTNTTIGQYGNGFKTSTMRLGADVVVFSRNIQGSAVTQSVGLLSYTFLRKTGREDVVVPMIDYEASLESLKNGEAPRKIIRSTPDDWLSNLSSMTQWSPYSSEADLLAQFATIGWHGTKVIIYNLWFNDDGVLELDFDTDEHDIQLRGGAKQDKAKPVQHQLAQQHIANRYHHSLRIYTSILYLQMPPGFQIILRGKTVEHHSIASDLKFPESIIYKPQIGDDKSSTTSVITVIGFTKEAPLINVHGFNVYHKNRLIMPFWKVWQENSSRGRGVVGVLEANFVEPAHDKQDFERTAVLLRLETRLKQMTVEYWNLHCHLIGYQPNTKAGKARKQAANPTLDYPSPIASLNPPGGPSVPAEDSGRADSMAPGGSRTTSPNSEGPQVKTEPSEGPHSSSKRSGFGANASEALERYKRQRNATNSQAITATARDADGNAESTLVEQATENDAMIIDLIQENTQLRSRCVDYELDVKKLAAKVLQLEKELLDSKMKNVNLEEQLEKVGLQNANNPRLEVKAEDPYQTGVSMS